MSSAAPSWHPNCHLTRSHYPISHKNSYLSLLIRSFPKSNLIFNAFSKFAQFLFIFIFYSCFYSILFSPFFSLLNVKSDKKIILVVTQLLTAVDKLFTLFCRLTDRLTWLFCWLTGCAEKPVDIYFLLDCSSSVWIVDFEKLLGFVVSIIERMHIAPDATRVGLGVFSNSFDGGQICAHFFYNNNG